MKNLECKQNHLHGCHTKRKIPSSFHMQEPQQIFANLEIKQNDVLLDLGCGAGDYTFYAGKLVGNFGKIYALDYFSEAIVAIQSKIDSEKIKNIKAVQADITQKFPIEDSTIDICFISTVLHTIELEKNGVNLFSEIKRVLKKDGNYRMSQNTNSLWSANALSYFFRVP